MFCFDFGLQNSSLFAFDAALVTAHALHNVTSQGLWVNRNRTSTLELSRIGPLINKQIRKVSDYKVAQGILGINS